MSIIIQKLEKYFQNINYPIHISFEPNDTDATLAITAGRPEDNGSLRIFLDFKDFEDILLINNIYGEHGLLIQERDRYKDRDADRTGYAGQEKRMDDLVYITLQKYIYQLLMAAIGKNFYPEIIPLEKHKNMFYKDDDK
jgi:hypothetical protein